jgi:uncharacterized membrane protein SpoIIM required for sporulation
MFIAFDILSDIINFISQGTVIGLPTIVFMAIPLIVGLIVGFLVKNSSNGQSLQQLSC